MMCFGARGVKEKRLSWIVSTAGGCKRGAGRGHEAQEWVGCKRSITYGRLSICAHSEQTKKQRWQRATHVLERSEISCGIVVRASIRRRRAGICPTALLRQGNTILITPRDGGKHSTGEQHWRKPDAEARCRYTQVHRDRVQPVTGHHISKKHTVAVRNLMWNSCESVNQAPASRHLPDRIAAAREHNFHHPAAHKRCGS
jgi:hypothetical protein